MEQQRLDEARARNNPDEARTTRQHGIANNNNANAAAGRAAAIAIANAPADNINDFLGDDPRRPAANQYVPRTSRPRYTSEHNLVGCEMPS